MARDPHLSQAPRRRGGRARPGRGGRAALLAAGLALASAVPSALAAGWDREALARLAPPLRQAVEEGRRLFMEEGFGGNGRRCTSCHLEGGTQPGRLPNGRPVPALIGAAATFPKYKARRGRVMTLADQVQVCVAGGIQGEPPAQDSDTMRALLSYLRFLSEGRPIRLGGS